MTRDDASRPARCGAFELGEEIGRGSMGVVHAARGPDGGAVAVKILHEVANLERFRLEAEAGRRVDHENVVRTIASGVLETPAGERGWLAMERVAGRTLRALREELDVVPETLLREIARQAARGLAALHAAGVIHRDLKPDNILIAEDDRVRIMDLGVAKMPDASLAPTVEGQFVGSLPYAAPEQCDRGAVDERSDLYSLGATLYELATGRNPFRRDGAAAMIRAQLEHVPPPASGAADVTPFFSAVLATLLAKQPEKRFASAAALARCLAEGEDGVWWKARPRGRRAPRIPVRRETSLHGRARELRVLRDAFAEAREGRGGAVLVEGEAGLGKSRLLDEFAGGLDDVRVVYGSFPPEGGFRGLGDALTEVDEGPIAGLFRGEPTDGDVFEAACCRQLREWAREGPVVWIVDDLHFAPARARAVVAALARTAADRPALLVATTRDAAASGGLPGARVVALGRLSPREVVELLREALGSERLADRLGGRVAYKSDGVPFFVFEMIRELKRRFLRKQPDGTWLRTRAVDGIEVPSAVRDLVAARLSALGPPDRALLDVASVIGYEFDAALVAAVLERPLVRVLQALAEVERRHGVVRAAGRRYRFDHHQIQEVVYDELAVPLREEYHALVAEAGGAAGRDETFVAWHHLYGSRPREAEPLLERALEDLEARHAYERAIRAGERALAVPGLVAGERRVRFRHAHAARLGLVGRRDEQGEAATAALEEAEEVGTPAALAAAHRALSAFYWGIGDTVRGLSHAEQDRDHAARAGEPRPLAAAHNNVGVALVRVGRYEEAEEPFREAARIAASIGEERIATTSRSNRAIGLVNLGRLAEACAVYEELLAEERPLTRPIAFAHGGYGLALYHLGRFGEARAQFERHLSFTERIGDEQGQAVVLGNLGLVDLDEGHYDAALRGFTEQRDVGRESGNLRSLTHAHLNFAAFAAALGRDADERRAAAEAFAHAREIEDERLAAHALVSMGRVEEALPVLERMNTAVGVAEAYLRLGRWDDVLALAERADVPAARALALGRSGRHDEVRSLLDGTDAVLPLHDRLELLARLGAADGFDRLLAGLAPAWRDEVAAAARQRATR